MIVCFTGLPGAGKTASAVRWAYKQWKKGRPVYSTISLFFDSENENVFRVDIGDIFDIRAGVVFVDEANLVFASRYWSKIPPSLIMIWSQHRKRGLDLILTSHTLKRLDVTLREIVQFDVRVKRLGRIVKNAWYSAFEKERVSTYFFWLSDKLMAMYDTFEEVEVPSYFQSPKMRNMDVSRSEGIIFGNGRMPSAEGGLLDLNNNHFFQKM